MPQISIVIPVYNAEKYIKRTVESVLDQDITEMEILLVNDGSKDNSLSIIKRLAKNDKRIKVFDQENLGVSTARNVGIDHATGDYIMFMDADDILLKNSLKKLLLNALENDIDISIGDIKNIQENDSKEIEQLNSVVETYSSEEMLQMFFLDKAPFNCYSACAKVYSKKIYKKLHFVKNRTSNEDRFYFFQSLCLTDRVVYENKCVYLYEKHSNSLSNSKVNTRILDNMYFADEMLKYIEKNKKSLVESARYNQLITYMMVYRNFCRDKDSFKLYKRELKKIRKLILDFKNNEIGFSKKIEIFIIKFLPFLYYFTVKIYDAFTNKT